MAKTPCLAAFLNATPNFSRISFACRAISRVIAHLDGTTSAVLTLANGPTEEKTIDEQQLKI
jgi:hypothetical protein